MTRFAVRRLPGFLRRLVLALSGAALLSACGGGDDDPATRLVKSMSATALARIKGGKAGPAAVAPDDLQVRAALQAGGKPILRMQDEGTGALTFLAPVGNNGGVTTWSSNDRVTLSTVDGVLRATRGFGSDLMSASIPSAAQIGQGSGTHDRLHVYLDGGDQERKFTFSCTLATVGPETITVMGLAFATRRVRETCTGTSGRFVNQYWFDGVTIRQSTQVLVPGVPNLTLQAIID